MREVMRSFIDGWVAGWYRQEYPFGNEMTGNHPVPRGALRTTLIDYALTHSTLKRAPMADFYRALDELLDAKFGKDD